MSRKEYEKYFPYQEIKLEIKVFFSYQEIKRFKTGNPDISRPTISRMILEHQIRIFLQHLHLHMITNINDMILIMLILNLYIYEYSTTFKTKTVWKLFN